jgi:ABC exporter DevB family membrane fusion protein
MAAGCAYSKFAAYILLMGASVASWSCSSSVSANVGSHRETPASREHVVLAAPGRIEGRSDTIQVGAASDGVIEAVFVNEGDEVRRGQILAKIGCSDTEAGLAAARADLEAARQGRARLLRGSREEEQRSAEQRTKAARAQRDEAALNLARFSRLAREGIISKSQLDQVQSESDVAEARLREAMRNEELIKAGPQPEEIAKADADVAAAEARVHVMEEKLKKCVVTAPISGSILRTMLRVGESFSSINPRPLFTIADLSARRVRAEIDERDVSKVRLNQRVLVSCDALPTRRLPGRISSLAKTMGRKHALSGDPAEKADRDVLDAIVKLDGNPTELPVGLRVTVQFLE